MDLLLGDVLRIKKPKHHFSADGTEWIEYAMSDKKNVGVFIFIGVEPMNKPGTLTPDNFLRAAGWRHLEEDFFRGKEKIAVKFETGSAKEGLIGTTDAVVRRIEIQDDHTLTLVIDHWADASGWVVTNGDGNRFRCWEEGSPSWTPKVDKAVRYARREDAEAVHYDDDGAWRVIPYSEAVNQGANSEVAAEPTSE